MRRNDECRAENFITGKKRYRKWIVTISILSIIVAVGTLYLLNKPATAVSEDGASSVGMVLGEGSSAATVEASANDGHGQDAVHVASVTEGTSEDGSSVSSTSASSASTASSASDAGVARSVSGVVLTGVFTDQNGKKIHEDTKLSVSDVLDLTAAPEKIEGYQYQKATINDKTVKSIRKITSSDDSATGSEAGASVSAAYMYVMEDDSEVKVTEDTEINFLYEAVSDARAVSVKATLVDEFGNEIDADRYSDIALPAFDRDGVLHLDDAENPPYEDVSVTDKNDSFKVTKYVYLKASIGDDTVSAIRRDDLNSERLQNENSSEAGNAASGISADTNDKSDGLYSYTVDGKSWKPLTENTVIKMAFSDGKKTEYVYEDSTIKVTAKLQKANAIPDDAILKVTPVTENTDGYNYDAYISALNENLSNIAQSDKDKYVLEYNENNTLLYDVAFIADQKELEPVDGDVTVTFEMKKDQISKKLGANEDSDLAIMHLPLISKVKDTVSCTSEATDITASDINVEDVKKSNIELDSHDEVVKFTTDSFCIFSLAVNNSRTWDGTQKKSAESVISLLGDASNFGAFTEDYYGNGDSETNIAVKNLHSIANQVIGNTSNVYTHITDYKINVKKVVSTNASDKTGSFKMALFSDSEGKNRISDSDFTISTDANGIGSSIQDGKFSSEISSIYVFELDSNGNPVKNGKSFDNNSVDYKVGYLADTIQGGNSATAVFSSSYVQNNMTGQNVAILLRPVSGNVLYYGNGTDNSYNVVHYPSISTDSDIIAGDFPINVESQLENLRSVSTTLADLTDSDSVEVLNVIGTNSDSFIKDASYAIGEADSNYFANHGAEKLGSKLLVINLDLTNCSAGYKVSQFKVNGIHTGDWNEIANQIIINPVKKVNGNYVPYDGKLEVNTVSGTIVAPSATVTTGGSISGSIIAKELYQNCEIHKISINRYGDAQGNVTVTNTPSYNNLSMTLYKYLDDADPGNKTFSFNVSRLNNKNWVNDGTVVNTGSSINYCANTSKNKVTDGKTYYYRFAEDSILDSNIANDSSWIIAKVKYSKASSSITYYRISDSNEIKVLIDKPSKISDYLNPAHLVEEGAFYNYSIMNVIITKMWNVVAGTALPDSSKINLTLYRSYTDANGTQHMNEKVSSPSPQVSGTNTRQWTFTWSNLPKYYPGGSVITYSVKETTIPDGYVSSTGVATDYTSSGAYAPVDAAGSATITNTKYTAITVKKNWANDSEDLRWSSVRVELQCRTQGETDYYPVNPAQTADLSKDNQWQHTFTDLPAVDENGEAYEYTVNEYYIDSKGVSTQLKLNGAYVHGYQLSDLADASDNGTEVITLTNTAYAITVQKIWKDSSGNIIPDEETKEFTQVVICLMRTYRGGSAEQVGNDITLSSDNNWKKTIYGLDKAHDSNRQYVYYIVEKERSGAMLNEGVNSNVLYFSTADGRTCSKETDIPSNSKIRGNEDTGGNLILYCINTRPSYALPETGSVGTGLFKLIGILLILIAAIGNTMLYFKRRKCK